MSNADRAAWMRRAQPLLGTLLEIGIAATDGDDHADIDAAFARVREIQSCLSRFEPDSDIARFHALRHGGCTRMRPETRDVLDAASALRDATEGGFDISLGTSPQGWRCEGDALCKLDDAVRLDLGGIGKGYAVDCAVRLLEALGRRAGWVNAGGDLRAFGDVDLPVQVRDELTGGVRTFASLTCGAFATSHFGQDSRSRLACPAGAPDRAVHVSVAAPQCMWADALTKIVAGSHDAAHPLLARYDATAWIH
jgi:thiamine biosynthesis lipoprotein